MRKRVLIPQPLTLLPEAEEILSREVEIIRSRDSSEAALLEVVAGVHGLVANGINVSAKVIKEGRLLEVVATGQVGFDRIDVAAATAAGVPVLSNLGVGAGSVAEFTIGLMISLCRGIVEAERDLRQSKDWTIRRGYEPHKRFVTDVDGSIVGIVGLGHIGAEVARRLRGSFDVRLLGYDPFVPHDRMTALGVEKLDDLLTLARQADFLLLHVPMTPDTRHMVGDKLLSVMKPTAFVINCARGPVVDEAALFAALQSRRIAGAALNIFEKEPIRSDHPLFALPNVILTPHIAGVTRQTVRQRARELGRRVLSVLAGEKPDGLVNPEVWTRFLERRCR